MTVRIICMPASAAFWTTTQDAGTLSLSEFISYGLELRRNPKSVRKCRDSRRSREDIGLYRHYHGPMYAYWIAFWTQMGVPRKQRIVMSA